MLEEGVTVSIASCVVLTAEGKCFEFLQGQVYSVFGMCSRNAKVGLDSLTTWFDLHNSAALSKSFSLCLLLEL